MAPELTAAAGARVSFDLAREPLLVSQWQSERVDPWLRVVVIMASLLFREQGADRLRVTSLLGDDPDADRCTPRAHGLVADLSVVDLVDGRVQRRSTWVTGHEVPKARWIAERLNVLFPHPDGIKTTARYLVDQGVIRLEIPYNGFRRDTGALAEWAEWGATGRDLTPRRIRV